MNARISDPGRELASFRHSYLPPYIVTQENAS